ncbi:MAG: thiol oxidoreductase [Neptuniibacter caesariensis]|uniref:Thiol oxidoreductase n=1 Tax=Neptuniibacter caesariensis TaxID=207954 RepID=A0A2G6JNZ2_NEPCE|nr:MAG: thiol oxidoreductase [Neptuniibacter caesariensis]
MKKATRPPQVLLTTLLVTSIFSAMAAAAEPYHTLEKGEIAQGGATTHFKKANSKAFSHPAANMPFSQQLDFRLGHGIFKKLWVASPSSTTATDGLGPLYNARSCIQCHTRDGRGHAPDANWPEDNAVSMFLRLSIPAQNEAQKEALESGRIGAIPDPVYGSQLQDFAVAGLSSEGRMNISYSEFNVDLSGGQSAQLRRPEYHITDLQYGPTHPALMLSPRIAPAMIGLGLLENIKESDIIALSDPDDLNGDNISGRPNQVWDAEKQLVALGRFGWKAGHPTVNQQNNSAFNSDIGISTPYAKNPYGDCTDQQPACLNMANGNSKHHEGLEASSKMNDVLLFYTRHIGVPARRGADRPEVLAGKKVFYESGCQLCHQPTFTTQVNPDQPQLSRQRIWPYTDLLLHDMGEGLADNRPEFQANGREWRTPPLWGIGLTKKVSGKESYLHDGRARTLLEAILWHGGEGKQAMLKVKNMPVRDRDNLIKFLESL